MKKIVFLLVFVLMAIIPFSAQAAKPAVKMAPYFCTYGMNFNNIALSDSDKKSLWQTVYNKLSDLQAKGKLPFQLEGSVASDSHRMDEMMLGGEDIFLIPTVMINSSKDTSYSDGNNTYYNSRIISGVSLIFCKLEENYDMDSVSSSGNGVSYRMLGMVPMVKADVIGLGKQNKEGGFDNLRTNPISSVEKSKMFINQVEEAVNNQLDFSSSIKNLKDGGMKNGFNTYQVTDVTMSSPKANEAFRGQDAEEIKFLVAYYYTSAYQHRNKAIVFPPAVGSNSMNSDVVSSMSTISLDSPNGKVDVRMSKPQNPVKLDISGANWNYQNNILTHKVWLAKSPVEGKEKAELERANARQLRNVGSININHTDYYSGLLIGLARELGDQKI